MSLNKRSYLARLDYFLGEHKSLIEVVGLAVALAVLCVYVWANILTSRSLSVSERALAASRDTANCQLRAYVGILKGVLEKPDTRLSGSSNGRLVLFLKNFGQTP